MLLKMQDVLTKGIKVPFHTSMNVDELLRNNKDVRGASPVTVELSSHAEDKVVVVEGKLELDVELSCSRCLEPTREHLSIPFYEKFQTSATYEERPENEDIIPVEEDKLNLTPYVEESVLLYMPFVPLCKEDCQGLCPQCGSNRNEKECGCSNEAIDPRFAALKDLFKDQ
ncbi:YceD family protein [Paenibacillus sp. GCM10012307]|uniref:DUF177 domain-containing protein n=1 Tax=Paenibacillus roseus TaxID=2798579 RepID=A0A934J9Y1_9BACL|nr:YceD family protein [Paenibacillus roseus]MBJ6363336.1 DUF177 domain-containing protein [Paenibacillus roseus]